MDDFRSPTEYEMENWNVDINEVYFTFPDLISLEIINMLIDKNLI